QALVPTAAQPRHITARPAPAAATGTAGDADTGTAGEADTGTAGEAAYGAAATTAVDEPADMPLSSDTSEVELPDAGSVNQRLGMPIRPSDDPDQRDEDSGMFATLPKGVSLPPKTIGEITGSYDLADILSSKPPPAQGGLTSGFFDTDSFDAIPAKTNDLDQLPTVPRGRPLDAPQQPSENLFGSGDYDEISGEISLSEVASADITTGQINAGQLGLGQDLSGRTDSSIEIDLGALGLSSGTGTDQLAAPPAPQSDDDEDDTTGVFADGEEPETETAVQTAPRRPGGTKSVEIDLEQLTGAAEREAGPAEPPDDRYLPAGLDLDELPPGDIAQDGARPIDLGSPATSTPDARTMAMPPAQTAPASPLVSRQTAPDASTPSAVTLVAGSNASRPEPLPASGPAQPGADVSQPVAEVPAVLEAVPHSLGVSTVAGYCEELIQRNSQFPAEVRRIFTTSKDLQRAVRIQIFQGESRRVIENVVLGQLVLTGLEPRPRGETQIEVTFHIDASGILHIRARDRLTGIEQEAQLTIAGAQSNEEFMAAANRFQQIRG
ncbi:MAG: Hsp70 family protein, partial [Myxococcota bacterium]